MAAPEAASSASEETCPLRPASTAPDPVYSEEARKAKYQGTVLLWAIVDASGRARKIRVVKSLGLGLDEEAVRAVQNWRFRPAERKGNPVPVYMNIEVNFRLL